MTSVEVMILSSETLPSESVLIIFISPLGCEGILVNEKLITPLESAVAEICEPSGKVAVVYGASTAANDHATTTTTPLILTADPKPNSTFVRWTYIVP